MLKKLFYCLFLNIVCLNAVFAQMMEDIAYNTPFPYSANGKKWGYINHNGRVVIAAKYDSAALFVKKIRDRCVLEAPLALVWQKKHCGVIDIKGNWVLKPTFDTIILYSNKIEGIIAGKKQVFYPNGKLVPPNIQVNYQDFSGFCGDVGVFLAPMTYISGEYAEIIMTVTHWQTKKVNILCTMKINLDDFFDYKITDAGKLWETVLWGSVGALPSNNFGTFSESKIYQNKQTAIKVFWWDTMTVKNNIIEEKEDGTPNPTMRDTVIMNFFENETPFYDTIIAAPLNEGDAFRNASTGSYWVRKDGKEGMMSTFDVNYSTTWYDSFEKPSYKRNNIFMVQKDKKYGLVYIISMINSATGYIYSPHSDYQHKNDLPFLPCQYKNMQVVGQQWLVTTFENEKFYLTDFYGQQTNGETLYERRPKGQKFIISNPK